MRFAVVMLLLACGPTPPTERPSVAAPPVQDAGVARIPDAPPDGPVAAAVEPVAPELAAAPAWIFRHYSTGHIVQRHAIQTWTLRFAGGRALLVVDRTSSTDSSLETVAWQPAGTTQYRGTTDGTKFDLAAPTQPMSLTCKRAKLAVAGAKAVRAPHANKRKYAECGDPGRWVPPATKKLDVLECFHPDFTQPMTFAAAPGIEFLYVNDDCDQQGGGYRQIAADGAVAPVR